MTGVPYTIPLRLLQASFVRRTDVGWEMIDEIAGADGVHFLCPRCFRANGGEVGTHWMLCWFEDKVPDDIAPGPGRWKPQGTTIDTLSFVPGKKTCSVQVGNHLHGTVTAGAFTVDTEGPE